MSLEIKGRVDQVLPVISGEGKNGPWSKQEYILVTEDSKYPKKICFTVWGDKIEQFKIVPGDELIASIEIESREYNEKWYTNVQAWKVEKEKNSSSQSNEYPKEEIEGNDLPF